ncbi:MAG: hypothetical protein ACD_3C00203G0001 [uncultured bacterium (gcode 4)]|uniref:Uncharacterized protein n=1 Tax=uncultured bacterium (gcode 4) TaxID=1234023 RepID=K2GBB1_9BACT|nr:MAG: hypothetical protein ACD_3C00203G0001 [uncultured bacterium (gcode 4)]
MAEVISNEPVAQGPKVKETTATEQLIESYKGWKITKELAEQIKKSLDAEKSEIREQTRAKLKDLLKSVIASRNAWWEFELDKKAFWRWYEIDMKSKEYGADEVIIEKDALKILESMGINWIDLVRELNEKVLTDKAEAEKANKHLADRKAEIDKDKSDKQKAEIAKPVAKAGPEAASEKWLKIDENHNDVKAYRKAQEGLKTITDKITQLKWEITKLESEIKNNPTNVIKGKELEAKSLEAAKLEKEDLPKAQKDVEWAKVKYDEYIKDLTEKSKEENRLAEEAKEKWINTTPSKANENYNKLSTEGKLNFLEAVESWKNSNNPILKFLWSFFEWVVRLYHWDVKKEKEALTKDLQIKTIETMQMDNGKWFEAVKDLKAWDIDKTLNLKEWDNKKQQDYISNVHKALWISDDKMKSADWKTDLAMYWEKTISKVKEAQKSVWLEQTGIFDSATASKILKLLKDPVAAANEKAAADKLAADKAAADKAAADKLAADKAAADKAGAATPKEAPAAAPEKPAPKEAPAAKEATKEAPKSKDQLKSETFLKNNPKSVKKIQDKLDAGNTTVKGKEVDQIIEDAIKNPTKENIIKLQSEVLWMIGEKNVDWVLGRDTLKALNKVLKIKGSPKKKAKKKK